MSVIILNLIVVFIITTVIHAHAKTKIPFVELMESHFFVHLFPFSIELVLVPLRNKKMILV